MSVKPVSARRTARLLCALAVVAASPAGCGTDGGAADARRTPVAITVAAASDLRLAFEELGRAFRDRTGHTVTFSFGSSGQLRTQILNGAPFDLFASANVDYVDDVVDAGRGDPGTRADYAFGRLALVAPPGREPPREVADLAAATFRRVVIANPEHAPYGVAAEQALEAAGVRERLTDRLVLAENVSDTLRTVQSGNAEAGIVALSLVITSGEPFSLVPEDLHAPLRQALVVTGSGRRAEAARDFARFVNSDAGRAVMVRYGFALPGERVPGAP
jgi:molybdate transport system substrate-binding protein